MTTATVVCGSCGTELPPNSKFCNECGAPVTLPVVRCGKLAEPTPNCAVFDPSGLTV